MHRQKINIYLTPWNSIHTHSSNQSAIVAIAVVTNGFIYDAHDFMLFVNVHCTTIVTNAQSHLLETRTRPICSRSSVYFLKGPHLLHNNVLTLQCDRFKSIVDILRWSVLDNNGCIMSVVSSKNQRRSTFKTLLGTQHKVFWIAYCLVANCCIGRPNNQKIYINAFSNAFLNNVRSINLFVLFRFQSICMKQ